MSLHRHAAKRDDVEKAISAAWAAAGARSESISAKGMPDRLVFHRGRVYLAEVKGAKRGLTQAQIEKFTSLGVDGIHVYVVRTAEDARALLSGTLAPWKPSAMAVTAEKKARANIRRPPEHRPGHSRARNVWEQCGVAFCPKSQLKGRRYCAEHEGKP